MKQASLILITTKGCRGCYVMNNKIAEVAEHNPGLVKSTEVYDIENIPEWIEVNVILNDFPTTLILVDDTIKGVIEGSCSVHKLLHKINEVIDSIV